MQTDNLNVIADIGSIEKNGMGEVFRARIVNWHGVYCLDLRVFVLKASGELVATRKGVSIPLRRAHDVAALVASGLKEASRLGIIDARPSHSHEVRQVRRDSATCETIAAAVQLHATGTTPQAIAEHFGVSRATVYRWLGKPSRQEADQGLAPVTSDANNEGMH